MNRQEWLDNLKPGDEVAICDRIWLHKTESRVVKKVTAQEIHFVENQYPRKVERTTNWDLRVLYPNTPEALEEYRAEFKRRARITAIRRRITFDMAPMEVAQIEVVLGMDADTEEQ